MPGSDLYAQAVQALERGTGAEAASLLVRALKRPGLVIGAFAVGYSIARIICEFFREPDPQLGFLFGASVDALGGGITMGMVLSLPMAIVGATAIALALRGVTRPRLPKAVEASSA